jgi:hypothetical protein
MAGIRRAHNGRRADPQACSTVPLHWLTLVVCSLYVLSSQTVLLEVLVTSLLS